MRVGPAFLQTFAAQVLQSAASIATAILIARGLGPAGQGRYALLAAAVGLLSTMAAAGQFEGHVLMSAGDRSWGRTLFARSLLQALGAVCVVSLTQRLWRPWLGVQGEDKLAILFGLVLVGEVVALLFKGINLGQHNITAYNVVTLVQRVFYFAVIAVIATTRELRLETVLKAWLVAVAANVILGGLWIWKHSGRAVFSWRSVRDGWGTSLSRGLRALLTIALTLVLVRADVYLIGPMLGSRAVGQVSVATTLAEYLWYVPSILGSVLFAAVAADPGRESVAKICRASRATLALLAPVSLGLAVTGRWIVPFIYGQAYEQAGILFVVLLPGMLAISLHLVIDSYFTGTGFPPITYIAAAGALAFKVVLTLLLVPRLGLAGAALATSVAYVSLLVAKVVALARRTGVFAKDLFRPTREDVRYNLQAARSWLQGFGGAAVGTRV